ncbi:hypothetical protein DAHU10_026480 [Hanseniaspora uvarum]|nr:hypothetical protein DAHU10_026480 [Hanseniaspora uvarum]
MISIDDWFAVSDKFKEQILFAVSSPNIQNSSSTISFKVCLVNTNLTFALIKGSSRSKQKNLNICCRTGIPVDTSTKCFKPVFVVPFEDSNMSLGKQLIDYSWVTVKHPKFHKNRLFLVLTTENYNIVYEVPDPLITADSLIGLQTCSLIHYQKHSKKLGITNVCDTSFGFSYTQPVLPQLKLDLDFPWNDQFLKHDENLALDATNDIISKALPFGKKDKDLFSIYHTNMLKSVTGKSWLHDDRFEDYGDLFFVSIFTSKNAEDACIQFENMCFTTNKNKASGIFNKFSCNEDNLFIFDLWSYISLRRRLIDSVKLAENDVSVLRQSISKIEDAWLNIINQKQYPENGNIFDCLSDFLIYGTVDASTISFLDNCFSAKNLKKLVNSIKSAYENAKKVSTLLLSLHLLKSNVEYFVAFLEAKKEFSCLIEDELLNDCNLLLNNLECFFNHSPQTDCFTTTMLFELLPKEIKSHETFITWITDLSKKHFNVSNINNTSMETDLTIYKYLKECTQKFFNNPNINALNKTHENTDVLSLLVANVEKMNFKKFMELDDVTDLPDKIQTLIIEYMGF